MTERSEGIMTGRVLVVGDIVTDVLAVHRDPLTVGSDTAARITLTGGGSAANTAAWLAQLGVLVTLAGVVGADAAGTDRLEELAAAGVDCVVRQTTAAPTGTVVVLSQAGERTMVTDRGANLYLSIEDIDRALREAPDAVHLHLSGYVLLDEASRTAGRYALHTAHERGLTTSVDAASAGPLRQMGGELFLAWVRGADLLLANLDEAAALPAALTEHVRFAVIKRGAQGAVWTTAGAPHVEVPAQPTTVVDVTGAGDAFAAGLVAAWCSGAEPRQALQAGARLGARAVATAGARPAPAAEPVRTDLPHGPITTGPASPTR
jgi:sugar/nucleoside kinase (ribokinase family)